MDDYTIISVHNHPDSFVPSLDDIVSAWKGKYKYGLAVCHVNTIYKYSIIGDLNYPMIDNGLDLLQGVQYDVSTKDYEKEFKSTLKTIRDGGVEIEVF